VNSTTIRVGREYEFGERKRQKNENEKDNVCV